MIYSYVCNWLIIDRSKPVNPGSPVTEQGRKCHEVIVRSLLLREADSLESRIAGTYELLVCSVRNDKVKQ